MYPIKSQERGNYYRFNLSDHPCYYEVIIVTGWFIYHKNVCGPTSDHTCGSLCKIVCTKECVYNSNSI